MAFVWAKPRLFVALSWALVHPREGKSLAQPGNLANSVALEPVALVLLAPFISAISAAAAAAVAAGESRCI